MNKPERELLLHLAYMLRGDGPILSLEPLIIAVEKTPCINTPIGGIVQGEKITPQSASMSDRLITGAINEPKRSNARVLSRKPVR